jgi:hypothetical protein
VPPRLSSPYIPFPFFPSLRSPHLTPGLTKLLASIPSAFFEASIPGVKSYNAAQRMACLLVKFCEYSLGGIFCGFIGQGIANMAMEAQ